MGHSSQRPAFDDGAALLNMFFLKRILSFIPLILLITFCAFVLARSMPGSPFDSERQPASPEIERALRGKYHL